jgi:hypothetical protein
VIWRQEKNWRRYHTDDIVCAILQPPSLLDHWMPWRWILDDYDYDDNDDDDDDDDDGDDSVCVCTCFCLCMCLYMYKMSLCDNHKSYILPEKLIIAQIIKKCLAFVTVKVLAWWAQVPTAGPYISCASWIKSTFSCTSSLSYILTLSPIQT